MGKLKLQLEETRKRCVTAWEAFTDAYVELADLQSEDEVQDLEERDQEYGNLEARYHDLVDSLAETVLQRGTQAETDRLQQEKTDQVAVRRLHIVSLYGEAKKNLSQLRDQLNPEELPPAEQLVLTESKLVSARCVMEEANKLALEVAGLKPDIAKEVIDADTAEKSSYYDMEYEILIQVNRFKAQYPQLSPVPATPPGTCGTPSASRGGHFRFERRTLPKFGGTLREYPTFRKDWTTRVTPNYDEQAQLYKLRGLVPESVKVDVEKFTTMAQFWEFMDVEFGNKNELYVTGLPT